MNIPEEAIEAAVDAAYEVRKQPHDATAGRLYRETVAALEAAAPFIAAQAWDEGCREGLSMNPGWDDVALSANPYRGDTQ